MALCRGTLLLLLTLATLSYRVEAAVSFLEPNSSLGIGEFIESQDGRFSLALEATGNLELRYLQEKIWETNTSGSGATLAVFQSDGNFVLYSEGGGSPASTTLEAEDCQFSNGTVKPNGSASKGQYVDFEKNGNLDCSYNATSGAHELVFTIKLPGGRARSMGVYVNDVKEGVISASTTVWSTVTLSGITLGDGANRIEVRDSENSRELDVDKLDITASGSNGGSQVIWAAGTSNQGADQLLLQDDGNLVIYAGTTPLWASGTCCYPPSLPGDDVLSETGLWGDVLNWRLIAIHSILTPEGKVLTYGTDEAGIQGGQFIYDVWDPETKTHETLPNTTGTDTFCSAPIIVPSTGEILMAGGDTRSPEVNAGVNDVNVFDPADNSLSAGDYMSYARWYPTITTLPTGELLIHGGRNGAKQPTITPEVFSVETGWQTLFGATNNAIINNTYGQWWYPRNFVAPDGRVFGITGQQMYYLDTEAQGSTELAGRLENGPTYYTSTAVMYEPGKILQTGGPQDKLGDGSSSTNRAITIDITGGTPVVKEVQPMLHPRQWHNSTLLPTGQVLITGGSDIVNELVGTAEQAELWDPVTETWTALASAAVPRLYHSSAILLPDATVLVAGGGAPGPLRNTNAEIYYPPYLFHEFNDFAVRPIVTGGTDYPAYGEVLNFNTNSTISRVTMLKTGAVTHSFNMDQRFLELDFEQVNTQLTANLPTSANLATPGSYMLFFIDDYGVPSLARLISIRGDGGAGGGGGGTGNNTMRYNGTGTQGTVSQTINLSPDTNYNLSVKLKVEAGSSGESVFDTDDRFDNLCQWTTSAGGWETRTCSFNSGSFTDVKLRMFAISSFNGEAFFDDIILTAEGSSTNLVTNGDFEDGTTGWNLPNDHFEVVDANGSGGLGGNTNTGAMRYTGIGIQGTVNQTIGLNTNTNYSISVDLKVAAGSSGRSVFDTNDRFDEGCQWTTPAGDWVTRSCTFNSGSFSDLRIRLFATGLFSGSAYFDNIVVTAEGSSTNLISNGDFENGTVGWNIPNDNFAISAEDLPQ